MLLRDQIKRLQKTYGPWITSVESFIWLTMASSVQLKRRARRMPTRIVCIKPGASDCSKNLTFVLIVRRGTGVCFDQRRRGDQLWRKVQVTAIRPWRPSRSRNRIETNRKRITFNDFNEFIYFLDDSSHVNANVNHPIQAFENALFSTRFFSIRKVLQIE